MRDTRLQIIEHGKIQWREPLFMEIFIIGAWSIWKERNNMLCNNITPTVEAWKRRFREEFGLLVHRKKEGVHPYINSLIARL
jgi:hypothetical protein